VLSLLLGAAACSRPTGPDPVEEGKRIQDEIRRAIITTKSLGRFGVFALFQEDLTKVPCQPALSETNRVCEVEVVGRGHVRMSVGDRALEETGRVMKDAVVRVEYPADCANQGFDFKTFDQVLPRSRAKAPDGMTIWENKLVRVTHWRLGSKPEAQCGVAVEAAPALLERIEKVPSL
jgi:hypothetical protein